MAIEMLAARPAAEQAVNTSAIGSRQNTVYPPRQVSHEALTTACTATAISSNLAWVRHTIRYAVSLYRMTTSNMRAAM
jgi:hypothetical protein